MNRIFKLICVFILLFTYGTGFCADAETAGDIPIFDLDLSGYQTNGTVSDKSGNNIAVTSTSILPLAGMVSYNNITTPYVVFNNEQNNISSGFFMSDSRFFNLPEITIEAWANPDHTTDEDSSERVMFSISKKYTSSTLISLFKSNHCDFYADKTQDIGQSTDISEYNGSWNHYVFTRTIEKADGVNTIKYCTYINGKIIAESEVNIAQITDETDKMFFIGLPSKLADASNVFRGKLSEFRIYNKALNEDDVLSNYFAQYASYKEEKPDEPSEPVENNEEIFSLDMDSYNQTPGGLSDKTGNITGITFSSEPSPQKNYYPSVSGQTPYITFSQENNQAIVLPADTIRNNKVLTAKLWVRYKNFMDRWQHPFGLYSKTSGFSPETFSNSGSPTVMFGGRFTITDISGMWTHFVYTRIYDENSKTIEYKTYVNGSLKGDITVADATIAEDNYDKFYIGTGGLGSDKNNQYTGDLTKFVLYNRELTAEEIGELYSQEKSYFDKAYFYIEGNESILSDDDKIEFSVDSSVNMDELDVNNFSFICKLDNREVRCRIQKDIQSRKIILFPDEYMKDGVSYKIELASVPLADSTAVSSAYYNFTTKKCDVESTAVWFNQNNDQITTLENITQLRSQVTLTNSAVQDRKCFIILISYNDKGQAVSIAVKESTVSANGFKKELLALDCGDSIANAHLRIFDVTNGNLAPVQNELIEIGK